MNEERHTFPMSEADLNQRRDAVRKLANQIQARFGTFLVDGKEFNTVCNFQNGGADGLLTHEAIDAAMADLEAIQEAKLHPLSATESRRRF